MTIDTVFTFLTSNPDYWWLALIVATVPVAKYMIKELPSLVRAIKPLQANIEEMASTERKASEEMKEIAQDFGVDRACLSLFHNGTKSLANIHFLKVSVIAEGLSGRVGSIMSSLQNRNVAEYGDVGYRLIINRENVKVQDVESIKESHSGLYILLDLHLVKSIYVMPIYNHNQKNSTGKPIVDGTVFIECCGSPREIDDQTLDAIQARAQLVYNELNLVNNRRGK